MHLATKTTLPLLLLLLRTLAVTAVARDLAPCVETCIMDNLSASYCDGDETGSALDRCLCAGLSEQTPMITCMKKECSTEDQNTYAENLPQLCRSTLFPDYEEPSGAGQEEEEGGKEGTSPASTAPESERETDGAGSVGAPGFVAVVGGAVAAMVL
ncbi:hypothetical protein BJX66DRAFT_336269 [Aspergillus keveii]|uniref:Extracellular membrane protein CFEM domain-containing protein n=1 Tax=Aspergillus keveii TaxID=714993 RepID=A0ABR4GB49_9EURO